WMHRLWQGATLVLLVSTVEDVGVMDAYATLKRAAANNGSAEIRVLINRYDFATAAADAERRIAAACRRFLGRSLRAAPRLPRAEEASLASNAYPRAWETPKSPFGRSVNQLGRFAADVLARQSFAPVPLSTGFLPIQEFSAC